MNKNILLVVIVIIVVGLILGFILQPKPQVSPEEEISIPEETQNEENTPKYTPTKAPEPTFPALSQSVKSVTDTTIVVTSKSGDMTLPKDSNKIKVFKRVGEQLVLSNLNEVKVDQKITLKIIVAGKQADLIIEQ